VLWEKGLIDKRICVWLETMVEINQELTESQKHEHKAVILGNTPKGLEVIYTQKRPIRAQKRPIRAQKRPIRAQKRPIRAQMRPITSKRLSFSAKQGGRGHEYLQVP
jgi:hypothetical protein